MKKIENNRPGGAETLPVGLLNGFADSLLQFTIIVV